VKKKTAEITKLPTPLYPVLIGVSLTRKDDERSEDTETERFFGGSVKIAPPNEEDNLRIAYCEFNAGEAFKKDPETPDKTDEDLSFFELKASYVIAIRPNEAE
jgi:hypothetical protein